MTATQGMWNDLSKNDEAQDGADPPKAIYPLERGAAGDDWDIGDSWGEGKEEEDKDEEMDYRWPLGRRPSWRSSGEGEG